jgi:hypothetical protein
MTRPLVLAAALLIATGANAQQPAAPATPDSATAQPPGYSVVEPKAPKKAKPAARKRAAKANAAKTKAQTGAAPAKPAITAEAETLKRSGPCVIKPVMSDQDLVNCGARPQH